MFWPEFGIFGKSWAFCDVRKNFRNKWVLTEKFGYCWKELGFLGEYAIFPAQI